MRFIPIRNVKSGEIVANDIFDASGRILLASGIQLTDSIIDRLKEQGYPGVYIGDDISQDISIPPALSPVLHAAALECIRTLNVNQSVPISGSIVEELLKKHIVSLNLRDIRGFDDYTYAHSVNVAVLAGVLGIGMKLPKDKLVSLVNAAILHDFGKLYIPDGILNKTSQLTADEYEIMKTHAQRSYNLIKDRDNISEDTKMAVLMHHENEDGSGYPNAKTGKDISLIAKILHVADVYDALISDRPYKKGYTHWNAAEYLMGASTILFDKDVVEHFVRMVPLYPLGAEIALSSGDICIVLENTGLNNLRPKVRRISDGKTIDLAERENIMLTIHSTDEEYVQSNESKRREMLDPNNKKRVVIVDDMRTNLQMLREILVPKYNVSLFKSGDQVLNYLRKAKKPDLIIMDIDMPEMLGTECAEIINEDYNHSIPILFVSALSSLDVVLKCRELKAAGYIIRPYNSVYIQSEVERIIYHKGVF
ncbi:MAG: response regulator [Lachnospiraceae bacterium]|nr:response regulator [Candidatus Merdinaster equi]